MAKKTSEPGIGAKVMETVTHAAESLSHALHIDGSKKSPASNEPEPTEAPRSVEPTIEAEDFSNHPKMSKFSKGTKE